MGVTVVSHSESFSSKLWQSYRGLIAPSVCDPVQQGTCVTFLFLIPSTNSIQTDLLRQQTPFQAKCQLLLWAALCFLSPPPLYPCILSSPDEIPLCSEVLPSLHFLLSCSFIINTVTHQILRSKGGGTIPLLWEAERAEPHTHTGVWGHLHNKTRQRSINCFTQLLVWMSNKLLQLD